MFGSRATLLIAVVGLGAIACSPAASSRMDGSVAAGTGGALGGGGQGTEVSGSGGVPGTGGGFLGSGGAAGSTSSGGRGGAGATGGAGGLPGSGGSAAGSGGRLTDAGSDLTIRDAGIEAAPQNLRAVMVVAGGGATSPGDNVMIRRLVAHGFRVTPIGDATVVAADVTGVDLVVISSSAESGPLGTKIRDVPVPMVCVENGEYQFMNMTGPTLNTDFGMATIQTQVRIAATTDPLAAGLTGVVTISSVPGDLGWAVPGPAAVKVASQVDNAAHVTLFGYAKGDQMVGLVAPARRVGFAIRETLAANLSTSGIALFDAAVEWALRP